MKIGYIGLGALGSELAKRFLGSHELHVWDVNGAACARFDALGARVAATAAELGRACDVILLCLPRSSDVAEVLFGPPGLAEALAPGKLVLDQTSGVPDETREMALRLASKDVAMMDAAVSASPHVVPAGGAILMAGGPEEVFELARPLLETITRTIIRCGSRVGDGQAMKMVNNAMNAGCRLGTLELVALGRKAGLSLTSMTEVLNRGVGRNQTTEKMLPAIARGEASTNFALALMLKDVNQAVELGAGVGVPMTVTRTVRALLQVGLNTRGPAARLEDMVGLIETMAAVRLAGPKDPDSPSPPELLDLVDQSVGAVCRAISCECLAVGHAYGLPAETMDAVLNRTSGWSAALQEVSSAMLQRVPQSPATLETAAAALRQTARLAIRHGAPAMIAGSAGNVFEHAVQERRVSGSVDLLTPIHSENVK